MIKRAVSVMLIVCAAFCFALKPSAESQPKLRQLAMCRKIYAYSGGASAYFYGFYDNTLVAARVLPDTANYSCQAGTVIRTVSHDENSAFALYQKSGGKYGVARLDMRSGQATLTDLSLTETPQHHSFTVAGNEIFLLFSGKAYTYVLGFTDGKTFRYELPSGAYTVFTNGGTAYAYTYGGEIYQIGQGSKRLCLTLTPHADPINAGCGWIYTSDGALRSLNGGGFYTRTALSVKTENDVLTCPDGTKAACALGDRAAMLYSDGSVEVRSPEIETTSPVTADILERLPNNAVVTVELNTTVSQLKRRYSNVIDVTDKSGRSVTSGKLRTGSIVTLTDGSSTLAVKGDINGSGTMNNADVKYIMQHFVDEIGFTECEKKSADLNSDGIVSNIDLVLLARAIKE